MLTFQDLPSHLVVTSLDSCPGRRMDNKKGENTWPDKSFGICLLYVVFVICSTPPYSLR